MTDMKTFGYLTGIVIIVIVIYLFMMPNYIHHEYMGEKYYLLASYDNTNEAARILHITNNNLLELLRYLKNKYRVSSSVQINSAVNPYRLEIINRILDNYNPESIYENTPTGKNGTSYTISKGEKLYMCVRDKETKKIHDEHILTFVALHELSHMGNKSWGHGDDFWQVFKLVLEEAKNAGVHEPVDYRINPVVYCGLRIDYNPYYDRGIERIN